jgi:hypothetical protein
MTKTSKCQRVAFANEHTPSTPKQTRANLRKHGGQTVRFHIINSVATLMEDLEVLLSLDIDVDSLGRFQARHEQLAVVVNFHSKANRDLTLWITVVGLARWINSVRQGVKSIWLEIRNIDCNATNHVVIIYSCIMIEDSNKKLGTGVAQVKDERTLGPGHPFWIKVIINNVRLRPDIFKYKTAL